MNYATPSRSIRAQSPDLQPAWIVGATGRRPLGIGWPTSPHSATHMAADRIGWWAAQDSNVRPADPSGRRRRITHGRNQGKIQRVSRFDCPLCVPWCGLFGSKMVAENKGVWMRNAVLTRRRGRACRPGHCDPTLSPGNLLGLDEESWWDRTQSEGLGDLEEIEYKHELRRLANRLDPGHRWTGNSERDRRGGWLRPDEGCADALHRSGPCVSGGLGRLAVSRAASGRARGPGLMADDGGRP